MNAQSSEIQAEVYIMYKLSPIVSNRATHLQGVKHVHSRPLPDVALTGKCTRECDEYGHSDSCWMPVRTSPERKQKSQPKLSTFMPVDERGSQEKLANGEASLMGDRNRNLLNKKLTSSYETFSAASFSKNEEGNPEDIPLTQTGEYKPSPVNTLTRREVYL
ncbi:PREDICTED: protocadherin-9-like [Fulmarus glacialis]|uniref:protocadherin-9-like n=1 Tax=Fulmarus glacialis TaxID=30455 RepID=UPI00051C237F|nr:PREDICTED: protocadherin-9-like [Fulmarus glacialis]